MMQGTLTLTEKHGERVIQIDVDSDELDQLISRIIPDNWFDVSSMFDPPRNAYLDYGMLRQARGEPFYVTANHDNARLLRMVMTEFPLKITTPDLWKELIGEIKKYEELADKLQALEPVDPEPQNFTGTLMPFQKLGLDFLLKTDGMALLADEMGLGKTVQTLAFVAQKPDSVPVVVVAPLVTLENWKREIEKFLRLKRGSSETHNTPRVEIIRSGKQKPTQAEFYLINYELVRKHVKTLSGINPRLVVFDEIQNLRNNETKKFIACNDLVSNDSVRYRIGLSGTPIYNRGIEMFGIANIIRPGIFNDRGEFVRRYCLDWNSRETSGGRRGKLYEVLRNTIMLRRKKAEVLYDLPEKNRIQQNIPIDTAMYEEELGKMYAKIEQARANLENSAPDQKKEGLLELNKQLREMRVAERQIAGLAKAPHILDYITSLLDDYEDEKFVVFCHHRSVHKVLFDGLWMFNPVQIIGGQSDRTRQYAIDDFNNSDDCRVIICGLRAGNVGINLTGAAYVIFAELDWSPAVHRQAEDRLHRIGQKRTVFSHYLTGIGTFDEILAGTLASKTAEINSVLGDKTEKLDNKKAIDFLEKNSSCDKA